MENPTVSGLRSRSRSKTPFLRSSCDHESCLEVGDHVHQKSGRKTPVNRSTPVRQLNQTSNITENVIKEMSEETTPASGIKTRQSTKTANEKLIKTSDYSSEESLDRLKSYHGKEIFQNEVNSQYERVSTSSHRYNSLGDFSLSPISTSHHVTYDRSSRIGSPSYSACSTDSSFAEQALADTSTLLDRDPRGEHLPSRLYKMAGEYWNKYPKTDYTYSPLSRDRVELAPGQVAMPNMSRRSLSQFRIQGPNTSVDEIDRLAATTNWNTAATSVRKRYTAIESSDDEAAFIRPNGGGSLKADQRWWITRLLMTIITTITTTTSDAYRSVVGPSHRYPYTDRRPARAGIVSRASSTAVAPFVWLYTVMKNVVTTTVTTVTETITPNHVGEKEKFSSRTHQASKTLAKRRLWPWFLLLLLPVVGYCSYYTYENWEHIVMPNFTDFHINLSEFSAIQLPKIGMPNITLPKFNLTMPEINITLPDISENLPEVAKTYKVYKDAVQNRVGDASDYMKVVAESCFEEMRRFWRGVIG